MNKIVKNIVHFCTNIITITLQSRCLYMAISILSNTYYKTNMVDLIQSDAVMSLTSNYYRKSFLLRTSLACIWKHNTQQLQFDSITNSMKLMYHSLNWFSCQIKYNIFQSQFLWVVCSNNPSLLSGSFNLHPNIWILL